MRVQGGFREAVRGARRNKVPVLAFNVVDHSSLRGVVQAAVDESATVIAQCSARTVAAYGATTLRRLTSEETRGAECYLHLDHCTDDAILEAAIEAGFDGVMADGSHLEYEENVRWTSGWAKRAHARHVLLEGELGAIMGSEDGHSGGPSEATPDAEVYLEFARRTGVDLLGAEIGTVHGLYADKPEIRFDLLEQLAGEEAPGFVVHGGSGLDAEELRRLVELRVVKLNFSTDLKLAWADGVRNGLGGAAVPEPLLALDNARKAVRTMACEKWRLCKGEG